MRIADVLWLVPLLALPRMPLHAQSSPPPCDAGQWHPECSTHGAQLTLVEAARVKQGSSLVVGYQLKATAIPAGKVYSLWMRPGLGKPYPLITGYSPDSAGVVTCADSAAVAAQPRVQAQLGWCQQGLGDFVLTSGPFVYGEAFRAALISTDDSVRVYAHVIPHPLEETKDGCTIIGETQSREIFVFSGRGFQPRENLRITLKSGGETQTRSIAADDAGNLGHAIVLPAVKGKQGGDASYEVAGSKCRVKLEYGWGNKTRAPR